MPSAATGERFAEDGTVRLDYRDARTEATVGAGETANIVIRCPFKPERLLADPDATVLQLKRDKAMHEF